MKKLLITILSNNSVLLVEYKRGNIFRLTLKRGSLCEGQWRALPEILPLQWDVIALFKQRLNNRILYEELPEKTTQKTQKPASLYKLFLEEWFLFYQKRNHIKPRFNATEGKALKEIIAYFQQICPHEEEAFTLWQMLLGNWDKMDKFHQQNTDLKYINGNLNKILQNAKRIANPDTNELKFGRTTFSAVKRSLEGW